MGKLQKRGRGLITANLGGHCYRLEATWIRVFHFGKPSTRKTSLREYDTHVLVHILLAKQLAVCHNLSISGFVWQMNMSRGEWKLSDTTSTY